MIQSNRKKAIIDKRTVIHTAYLMLLEDPEDPTFTSRDMADATNVPLQNAHALIRRCQLSGFVCKVGEKKTKGRPANIYMLTDRGIERGQFYFERYNPITGELDYKKKGE